MNKRGQFFLIMAVIIGALLLGATSLYNKSQTSDVVADKFNVLCENYYYEVQQLNKEFIVEKGQATILSFSQETEEFTEEFEEEYKVNIEILSGEEEYNNFHFKMSQEKEGEVYVCEK
jgi:maltose-binding protein MalE